MHQELQNQLQIHERHLFYLLLSPARCSSRCQNVLRNKTSFSSGAIVTPAFSAAFLPFSSLSILLVAPASSPPLHVRSSRYTSSSSSTASCGGIMYSRGFWRSLSSSSTMGSCLFDRSRTPCCQLFGRTHFPRSGHAFGVVRMCQSSR